MKKLYRGAAVLALVMLAASAALALAAAKGKEGSIEGEIVDTACFLKGDKRGAEHKKCAMACSKDGIPTGIVDAAGKMYVILGASPGLAEHQAEQARITGTIFEEARAIDPRKLEIKKEGKWVEVPLPESMM
jgi:hypothetical protein